MSDTQQAQDWWLANDGKWYPPERHPDYTPPPPGDPSPGAAEERRQCLWCLEMIKREALVCCHCTRIVLQGATNLHRIGVYHAVVSNRRAFGVASLISGYSIAMPDEKRAYKEFERRERAATKSSGGGFIGMSIPT